MAMKPAPTKQTMLLIALITLSLMIYQTCTGEHPPHHSTDHIPIPH
jgi:hypothetical protein